jgi:hypothetical protein
MPNISQNVNSFLNFPAEKSKTYANRYSLDRIFAEKSLNGVAHSSDVSAAHGIINPPFSCRSSITTAQYRENHRTGLRADCGFLIFDSKKVRAKSLGLFFGRGTKARTQKNGFGDRYVTITSYP